MEPARGLPLEAPPWPTPSSSLGQGLEASSAKQQPLGHETT